MSIYLKIKIKSLAEEARMIRKEERKQLGYGRHLRRVDRDARVNTPEEERWENNPVYLTHCRLHHHRVVDVRKAAREAQLAYAYLRGRPLLVVEPNLAHPFANRPKWNRVRKLVLRYYEGQAGEHSVRESLRIWVQQANLPGNINPLWLRGTG